MLKVSELQEMNNKIHERLKRENELLIADKNVLQAKWEGQGLMIQKLHQENAQVKGAYEDRVGDIESLGEIINEIRVAYESEDENVLDEYLHDLFTNQLVEDY